jgi:hypothetical protein
MKWNQGLFIGLFSMAMLACKEEAKSFTTTAPDGKAKIIISGTKETSLSPWRVSIMGQMGDPQEAGVITEIFCKALDSPYVKAEWQSNLHALIGFKETDDKIRLFEAIFSETSEFNIREVREEERK